MRPRTFFLASLLLASGLPACTCACVHLLLMGVVKLFGSAPKAVDGSLCMQQQVLVGLEEVCVSRGDSF